MPRSPRIREVCRKEQKGRHTQAAERCLFVLLIFSRAPMKLFRIINLHNTFLQGLLLYPRSRQSIHSHLRR